MYCTTKPHPRWSAVLYFGLTGLATLTETQPEMYYFKRSTSSWRSSFEQQQPSVGLLVTTTQCTGCVLVHTSHALWLLLMSLFFLTSYEVLPNARPFTMCPNWSLLTGYRSVSESSWVFLSQLITEEHAYSMEFLLLIVISVWVNIPQGNTCHLMSSAYLLWLVTVSWKKPLFRTCDGMTTGTLLSWV